MAAAAAAASSGVSADCLRDQVAQEIHCLRSQLARSQATLQALVGIIATLFITLSAPCVMFVNTNLALLGSLH